MWRKGLEESQVVVLWKDGWEHGSLEVGMLRDSRALNCFGSRVDEDEEGEDGEEEGEDGLDDGEDVGEDGLGDGEDVGEGVGGRGGEAERVMAGKRKRRMRSNGVIGGDGFIAQLVRNTCRSRTKRRGEGLGGSRKGLEQF